MTIRESERISADENERVALRKLEKMLNSEDDAPESVHALPRLVGPDGEIIELPPSALRAFRQMVSYMSHGKDFGFVLYDQLLSTQEAAELLNMSRPSLIKVLEEGEIPFIKVGTHRRIQFGDVMEYKRHRHEERLQGLEEMAHLSQDLGIY